MRPGEVKITFDMTHDHCAGGGDSGTGLPVL